MLRIGSKVVKCGQTSFWAARGLIHAIDERNGNYKIISVREMLHRMEAIQDIINNSSNASRQKHSHDKVDSVWLEENQTMIEKMLEVVNEAQIQGMPTDPTAVADMARRQRKVLLVSGLNAAL
jgi:sugar-specific transcriptional regulator TrmB